MGPAPCVMLQAIMEEGSPEISIAGQKLGGGFAKGFGFLGSSSPAAWGPGCTRGARGNAQGQHCHCSPTATSPRSIRGCIPPAERRGAGAGGGGEGGEGKLNQKKKKKRETALAAKRANSPINPNLLRIHFTNMQLSWPLLFGRLLSIN